MTICTMTLIIDLKGLSYILFLMVMVCISISINSILGDMIIEAEMNLHSDFEIKFDIEGQVHISHS